MAVAVRAEVRLDVRGGPEELREALAQGSGLVGGLDPALPVSDQIALARADYARLLAVLYDYGYFAGVISIQVDGREAGGMSPFAAPRQIGDVQITVDPGQRFALRQAEIGPLAPGALVPADFRPGAVATTGRLRDVAGTVIGDWREAGFAVADVANQSIRADNRAAVLDVAIRIDPGPQLDFGPLVPSGQDRMPLARVQEIAGLPVGEPFHPDELDRAAERLRRTGVFNSVALREGAVRGDGTIEIEADLVEAPLRRFGFGAELSSTDGLMLSTYWLHRNLTGGGERLRFDAEISGIGQGSGGPDGGLAASFSRPATATPDTTFTASVGLDYLDEETFQELIAQGQAGVEQQISDDLVGRVALGFRFSDISDNFGDRQATLVTLPSGLTFDNRDNGLDAASGYYADLDLTPFFVTGSGDVGLRAQADLRGYAGFGAADRTRLAARVQLGTVEGAEIADLPPDYLFFSGGGGTVRGQDFRGLGAVQAGQPAGGRSFAGLSLELRQDITDSIGAVAFYDTGYIAAGSLWDDSGDWHSGAGLGVRYTTPVGAIRLDLAAPVSGPGSSSDVYVYIGIGQSF